jgi:hypothetical protein
MSEYGGGIERRITASILADRSVLSITLPRVLVASQRSKKRKKKKKNQSFIMEDRCFNGKLLLILLCSQRNDDDDDEAAMLEREYWEKITLQHFKFTFDNCKFRHCNYDDYVITVL